METHGLPAILGEFGLVVGALGLFGAITAAFEWRRGQCAASWPAVPGVVIHSHLKKVKSGSSVGHGTGPHLTVYRPQVIYSYEIQGRRLEGRRLRFGSEPHTRAKSLVQENVAKYKEGSNVTVHYDPAETIRIGVGAGRRCILESEDRFLDGVVDDWRNSLECVGGAQVDFSRLPGLSRFSASSPAARRTRRPRRRHQTRRRWSTAW